MSELNWQQGLLELSLRIEELEQENMAKWKRVCDLEKDNTRYREALEKIADCNNHFDHEDVLNYAKEALNPPTGKDKDVR